MNTTYKDELITYHLNTYNRHNHLKNLLNSFEKCNVHENFEWVITDYGSVDGTRDYLNDMSKNDNRINVIFNNEKIYFNKLKKLKLEPKARHQIIAAIFGKAINEARAISNGNYYIHVADDHQFIRKGNWFEEMLEILDDREQKIGKKDISSVLYRGLPLYRIFKKNNETFEECKTKSHISYFVAKHKHYDDYHLMTKEVYNNIGNYFEIHQETRQNVLNDWQKGEKVFNHYIDYLERSKELGYSKIFMKIPYAVDLDGTSTNFNSNSTNLVVPLISSELLVNNFKNSNRPVSSNEVIDYCKRNG